MLVGDASCISHGQAGAETSKVLQPYSAQGCRARHQQLYTCIRFIHKLISPAQAARLDDRVSVRGSITTTPSDHLQNQEFIMDPASEAQAAIDPDIVAQLNSADASSLLDTIDSLREIGVSSFVDLPQIIVVGDQSSGKSSVLEAISRVRFPIDGRLCTRFATELVLRRAPTSETISNVSIQFADSGDAARLPFKRTTFDKEKLPDLIKEAREVMGIRDSGAKQFSKDILRIEVTGPDVPPITLVDLPGIFQSETANQDARGRDIVNQLVESYMAQSKSIILIVLAANSQLANQGVLDKAREHDPKRERTIGVITKPDKVDRGSSDEREYLDLVKGREAMHKLALGWYVLRNPSEEERSSETNERDAAEKTFFRAGWWSSLDPAHRGAESLRKRLSKVLLDHVKKSLPELIANIDHKLRDRKRELDRLGKSRLTADELRSYLLGITENFRGLAHDAIEGRYSRANEFFGDLDQEDTRQRKLRAVLRNSHDAFEMVMETKGARYKIGWSEDDEEGQDNDEDNHGLDDEDEDDVDDGSGYSDSLDAIPDHLQLLVDGYDAQQPEWKPVEELHAELDAPNNRGNEFPGEVNPELGFLLFKRQTAPWQHISQQHLDKVLDATKVFVEEAFTYIVGPDDATLRAILGLHADKFFDEKKAELQAKLQELLRPYSDGYGLLLERKAHAKMYQTTSRRLGSRVAARLESKHPDLFGDDPRGGLTRDTLVSAICEPEAPGRKTSGIEKVIDMMTVRYEVSQSRHANASPATCCANLIDQLSLGTFTENVVNLAVESCLIHHIPTILTTGKIYDMSFDELKELASESEEVQKRRVDLEAEVKILEEGLRKCQRQKPRPLTRKR
ncbi:P-loop containing nucleoside triphosphate hydrolase protein [Chaetomium sp. MPI-SDFR-AT-0129]|nr:P-loop containing nucleoside triphosphate hydrolase protein [Chaetomium sp. MPI-SDFR-AT-0129]